MGVPDGVGSEGLEPPPVDVGEGELRAGVGAFPAHDDPHPGRPAGRGQPGEQAGEQTGELGDVRAVAAAAVGHQGGRPRPLGQGEDAVCTAPVMVNPTLNSRSMPSPRLLRRWSSQSFRTPGRRWPRCSDQESQALGVVTKAQRADDQLQNLDQALEQRNGTRRAH